MSVLHDIKCWFLVHIYKIWRIFRKKCFLSVWKFLYLSSHMNIFFKTKKMIKLLKKSQKSYSIYKRPSYSNSTPFFTLESIFWWPLSRGGTPHCVWVVKNHGGGREGGSAHHRPDFYFYLTPFSIGGHPHGWSQKIRFKGKIGRRFWIWYCFLINMSGGITVQKKYS